MASNLSFVIDISIKKRALRRIRERSGGPGLAIGTAPFIPSATRHSIYEGRQSKADLRPQQLKSQRICPTKP
ncbi:hypothetical protein EMIT0P171_30357 [Pseudomonas sp. IT-P171]